MRRKYFLYRYTSFGHLFTNLSLKRAIILLSWVVISLGERKEGEKGEMLLLLLIWNDTK